MTITFWMPALTAGMTILCLSSHAEVIDRVVAVVGKEPILQSEVDVSPGGIDQLIIDKVISLDLRKSGQEVTSSDIDEAVKNIRRQHNLDEAQFKQALAAQHLSLERFRTQLKEQIAHMKLVQNKIKSRIHISEDDIQAAYDKKYGSNLAQMKPHLKHLLFKKSVDAHAAQARFKPGMSFSQISLVAKKINPSVVTGDFGEVSQGQLLPEIERIAFALRPGELGGPIKTPEGYHFIYVEALTSSEKIPLEKVRKDLHKELESEEVERELQRYLDEIKSKTFIEVRR